MCCFRKEIYRYFGNCSIGDYRKWYFGRIF
ncbi:hypothetical protein VPHK460_0166 [Vibrio phage K460]